MHNTPRPPATTPPRPKGPSKARIAATIALQTPAHPRPPASDRHAPRPIRAQRAADEFARWRPQNPNATSAELRRRWRQIQVDWNLSTPASPPR